MESSSTVLYNPFTLPDHIHFPSFTDAFGDLLKIEAENLKKINDGHKDKDKAKKQKDRTSNAPNPLNSNTTNSNKNKLKNRTTTHPTKSTKSIKSIKCIKSKSKIYCEAVTPMPTQKSKKKNFMFSNPKKSNTITNNNNNNNNNNNILSPSDLPITPIIATKSEPEPEPEPEIQTNTNNNYKKWNKPSKMSTSYGGLCTPMPKQKKKKKKVQQLTQQNNNKENLPHSNSNSNNNSIIVTPAPGKKSTTKTTPNEIENDFDKSIIMMADILSPNPNNRYELSSPAPNDKNARLLTKTPAKFPICMPPTPMLQGTKKRNALEEKLNNDWFNAHKPVLTPCKIRENPIKLYDPSKDMNVTIMLEQMDTPFDDETETLTAPLAAPPPQLLCDISMIMPLSNENLKGKKEKKMNANFSKNFSHISNNIAKKKSSNDVMSLEFDNSIFVSGNSFAFDNSIFVGNKKDVSAIGNDDCNDKNDTMPLQTHKTPIGQMGQLNQQFSDIKIHKTKKKIKRKTQFHVQKFSDIKIHKIKKKVNLKPCKIGHMGQSSVSDEDEDDLLNMEVMSMEVMSDAEFFSISGTEQKSTQTMPVLIFNECDIPKIRYNGRLMSEYLNNESNNCVQSGDKIVYNKFNMYTPPLRYNKDSIECFEDMSSVASASDSDGGGGGDGVGQDKMSMSYNSKVNGNGKNNVKKKNGDKMLREYKQSKLAQNPNWTICNAYDKTGDLI